MCNHPYWLKDIRIRPFRALIDRPARMQHTARQSTNKPRYKQQQTILLETTLNVMIKTMTTDTVKTVIAGATDPTTIPHTHTASGKKMSSQQSQTHTIDYR